MLDLRSGMPYWLVKNGLPYQYPKLRESITTDVVILGGGISGALMSYYLTKAGVDHVVIDGRSIGMGSTAASTGLLQYEIDVPLSDLADKIGLAKAARAYLLSVEAISELKNIAGELHYEGFTSKPSLYYAARKGDHNFIKKELLIRQQQGIKADYVSGEELERDFGFSAAGAIYSYQAAQVDPYGFTHAMLQYSISRGVRVFDRTPVPHIDHRENSVVLTTEDKFTIHTGKLIYANGYEVSTMVSRKIVKLNSTYATISENPDAKKIYWKENALMWSSATPYLYIRTTNDGRLLIGGRDENFFNPEKRDALLEKKKKQLVRDFNRMLPHIPFIAEYSWAGTFGSTEDGLPYIGTLPEKPNGFFSLGFGGNGITFGQIGARMITDMILGKKNEDIELFSFDR